MAAAAIVEHRRVYACRVHLESKDYRCTRGDPTLRHSGVLLFAACAHHSVRGFGLISTGIGGGPCGAVSASGNGSSGSTAIGGVVSGMITLR